jgi:predicted nucleic acid-binding protein
VSRIIADTGPLVAFLQENDAHSEWTRQTFDRLTAPFLTCESVISEACFLVGRMGGDPNDLLDLVARGLIELRFDLRHEVERVRALMKRYRSVPMSLADACLVRMSEQTPACRVVTFDRDFRIYRRHDRRPIPVLMPDDL